MNEDLIITALYDVETGIITSWTKIGSVEAVGSAKCMNEDEFDTDLGTDLALGRSLQKLGKLLEKDAFREVHRRDELRKNAKLSAAVAKGRQSLAKYQWECEFAELINLKLAEESTLVENDVVPEPVVTGKRKMVDGRKKQKPRKKAHQIRDDLPA